MGKAEQAHEAGNLLLAEQFCLAAVEADSSEVAPLFLLGVVLWKQNRFEESVEKLGLLVRAIPEFVSARIWYSVALRSCGNLESAHYEAIQALLFEPKNGQALIQKGFCLSDLGQFQEAASAFRKAIVSEPTSEIAYRGLGLAYRGAGKRGQATAALKKAVEYGPRSLASSIELLHSLVEEFDPSATVDCARKIQELQPDWAQSEVWLAKALLEDNKPKEAETHIQRAIELDPNDSFAHCLAGWIHQANGKLLEAEEEFSMSIEIEPIQGFAYSSLGYAKPAHELGSVLITQMRSVADGGNLTGPHACQIQFGLGRVYENMGQFEQAANYYEVANQLAFQNNLGGKVFDANSYARGINATIDAFHPQFFDQYRTAGADSARPIFVVGQIRSGTTLVAQILSAHPKIDGAGELRFWAENANSAWEVRGRSLDKTKVQKLENDYLRLLDGISSGANYVVNKLPTNYLALGLIHVAFPNAKIIHISRHPIDTCLSIYTTSNPTRSEWAYQKEAIMFVHKEYLRLMDHWRNVLPVGSIFEVSYEDLVTNRESTTRELLSYCGADWHEACLFPEKNPKGVVTPSVWQVRQPVYATSIGRWKQFEPWLGSFAALHTYDCVRGN